MALFAAVALGATEVYVLQVGHVERPLSPPRAPWQVALVAFEIARRHRFARDIVDPPPGVTVRVLPSGSGPEEGPATLRPLRYRSSGRIAERIERAYAAPSRYPFSAHHDRCGCASRTSGAAGRRGGHRVAPYHHDHAAARPRPRGGRAPRRRRRALRAGLARHTPHAVRGGWCGSPGSPCCISW
ncbi:hypothetical protein A6P39_000970 [Streptomyces sp. FXJ1.172]|uniref:hypothetical protein n=1 Tax=Streptomyces sp. FXJ1.172 TaxID=710705 RepID=UPI000AD9566D|nr:hypothetical protein [Streptomyces sp. FXJ1.172]WEO92803.1 hypothetical protein A6P39_000970 [Streptomyces sp. FXJ1.172]